MGLLGDVMNAATGGLSGVFRGKGLVSSLKRPLFGGGKGAFTGQELLVSGPLSMGVVPAGSRLSPRAANIETELMKTHKVLSMGTMLKEYYNPEIPEASNKPTQADLDMLRIQAEDAARRRRGLMGRSLLRSSLGAANSGGGTLLGGTR